MAGRPVICPCSELSPPSGTADTGFTKPSIAAHVVPATAGKECGLGHSQERRKVTSFHGLSMILSLAMW